MNYKEQLQTPEWKAKRLSIMKRDSFTCCRCASKKELQVHHKRYGDGMAWETPDKYLITLCRTCHEKAHDKGKIPFVGTKKKKPKRTRSQKAIEKINRMGKSFKNNPIGRKKLFIILD